MRRYISAVDEELHGPDPANGFEIWRRFLEEWEPAHRRRYRAMLMQLLQFPFTGDRGQALEEWERLVRQYEAQSSDTLQDTIKAAVECPLVRLWGPVGAGVGPIAEPATEPQQPAPAAQQEPASSSSGPAVPMLTQNQRGQRDAIK